MKTDDKITIHSNPPRQHQVDDLIALIQLHRDSLGLPHSDVEMTYSAIVHELDKTGVSPKGFNGTRITAK